MADIVNSAGIVIFQKDLVLLCNPAFNQKKKRKIWTIPKGHVEEGETLIEAAIRETYEESNIDLKEYKDDLIELGSTKLSKKIIWGFLWEMPSNYKYTLKCNSTFKAYGRDFDEICEFKWFSPEEAIKHIHSSQEVFIKKTLLMLGK